MNTGRSTPDDQIKARVHAMIDQIPDGQFSMHEVAERFCFIDQIERGIRDCDEGRTCTTEELMEHLRNQPRRTIREMAHDIVDELPAGASMREIGYEFFLSARLERLIKQDVESGLYQDMDEGST